MLLSCSKDGEMGPPGEQGLAGATILSGPDDPASEAGKPGDFHLNTDTYMLFGPKTASGWGDGKSILGEKGDQGEADYVLLSGETDPDPSLGESGDFYYNTLSRSLFYRLEGGWELSARLANTIQFTKTGVNLGASGELKINFGLPKEIFNNSMVHVYVFIPSTIGFWRTLPGYINQYNMYNVMFESYTNHTTLIIERYSSDQIYSNCTIRIVAAEADRIETLSRHVDFNDYESVKQYFDLQD